MKNRILSFRYAIEGLSVLLRDQPNARIHLIATVFVVVLGVYLKIEKIDWCILVVVISIVWVAEAMNSALEYLCDKVSPNIDPLIKKSKDVAAAAVLISAVCALIVGVMVLSSYI